MPIQEKLIQLIKKGTFYRVAGKKIQTANIRLILTEKQNLRELIKKSQANEELLYLFNFIKVPPLRKRDEDIELLAYKFLNRDRNQENHKTLSPEAIILLKKYDWPGNVRELRNIMEEAYLMTEGSVVEKSHLPARIMEKKLSESDENLSTVSFCGMTLGDIERKYICDTLRYTQGNKTKTAKLLGITVKTLYNKLHSYGMIEPKY
jgi:Nif-specific regulatory protein